MQALARLKQRQAFDSVMALDLSQQTAHFFNPHTNILEIESMVKSLAVQEGEAGLHSSNMLSRGQLKANMTAEGRFHKQQMKTDESKRHLATHDKAMKVYKNFYELVRLGKKIAPMGVGAYALYQSPDLQQWALKQGEQLMTYLGNADVATVAGVTAGAIFGVYHLKNATLPAARAWGSIMAANVGKDRRYLDQVTGSNKLEAAAELKKLKLGQSI